MGLIRELNE
ncbi:unnamed protein product, partial [Didymodactylos carnosus]